MIGDENEMKLKSIANVKARRRMRNKIKKLQEDEELQKAKIRKLHEDQEQSFKK